MQTTDRGYGAFATRKITEGEFIVEYAGHVVHRDEYFKKSRVNAKDFYAMELQGDFLIDASKNANLGRFLNHSCDPNCETQKWYVSLPHLPKKKKRKKIPPFGSHERLMLEMPACPLWC